MLKKCKYIISLIIRTIYSFSCNVFAETLVISASCSADLIEMCTCATRVLSDFFGPSRRRFSVSIPQAQLSIVDWPKLFFHSNEQRDDWLFGHCVTPLKLVFYLRFLPDSDTCRIAKQRGPRSATDDRQFQLLYQRRFCPFA